MTTFLLAFSASGTFAKAGALVAFVLLAALAVLFLLALGQGREIKHLRESAGRAAPAPAPPRAPARGA